jgi:adenylate kinase
MARRYRCVLLFGAPGVGKGTQGKRLGEADGFHHLATGDIFRALDKESDRGKEFLRYSTRGELVPDALTIEIWQEYVEDLARRGVYDPEACILLLDGIPRSLEQARILDDHIEPLRILHLTAPDLDAMVERMKARAEKEGRPDDADEEVIRRRFDVYRNETSPVLGHYDDGLVCDIDAMGTIDEVTERVRAAVADLG